MQEKIKQESADIVRSLQMFKALEAENDGYRNIDRMCFASLLLIF